MPRIRARAMWVNEGYSDSLDNSVMVLSMSAQDFARVQAALQAVIDLAIEGPNGGGSLARDLKPIVADLDTWATT